MRTPGDDANLAAGFLLSEGVVSAAGDIESIEIAPPDTSEQPSNRVVATLSPRVTFDPESLRRDVYAASSCGICGRASIDRIRNIASAVPQGSFLLPRTTLLRLPAVLRAKQSDFARTGGVHAAGLFMPDGTLLDLREDVGRHNAVDKVLGRRLLRDELPATGTILVVSGRAGFELVHKAVVAGVPMLAAVGAPSSLAVSLAKTFGLTLVGFLRGERFNLYTGAERIDTTA
jgi:FdhD protein